MRRISSLLGILFLAAACTDANADSAPDVAGTPLAQATAAAQDLPTVLVYKTPTCGCCNGWVEHMEAAGFAVDARNVTDIMTVKHDSGVPVSMSSCHTSIIDGYVVEGHVPAEQVMRLLAERPDIAGIAAPGMPIGSPGMEGRNAQPYEVLSFTHSGESAVFAEVDPR